MRYNRVGRLRNAYAEYMKEKLIRKLNLKNTAKNFSLLLFYPNRAIINKIT